MSKDQKEDCIFCQIVNGKIPVDLVYESDDLIAFPDINPKAPVHIVIIPKRHIDPNEDISGTDYPMTGDVLKAAKNIASKKGVAESGFRLLANVGADAGQEIDHLHFHLLGGRRLGDLG